jgi:hypothetical protein
VIWAAAEFHNWYSKTDDPMRKQRALDDLTSEQIKEYREWLTFSRFARVSTLDIDPRTIENRKVPEPDIFCEVSKSGHFFELGEVTDQSIAENASIAERTGSDIHGGFFSQDAPLEKMIFQKCSKSYSLNDLPASLLLHYAVGHQVPCPEVLADLLSKSRERIITALRASAFQAIWFYDSWDDRVLGAIER